MTSDMKIQIKTNTKNESSNTSKITLFKESGLY